MLLSLSATSGPAWCCWWLCCLVVVDGKLQKKFHSQQSSQENVKRARCRHQKSHIDLAREPLGSRPLSYSDICTLAGTRLDGAQGNKISKFGASMFEPKVFRKQMYSIEESTCDIFGTFRCPSQSSGAPRSDSVPENVPLVTPLYVSKQPNQCTHYSAVSADAETSAKYQLSTAWWND